MVIYMSNIFFRKVKIELIDTFLINKIAIFLKRYTQNWINIQMVDLNIL